MNLDKSLKERSDNKCEFCSSESNLSSFLVPPKTDQTLDNSILACENCNSQIADPETMDANHWRCLNESIWSEVSAVKVMSWRMLHRLKSESWTQDLLDMMYLEEDTLEWAKATGEGEDEDTPKHRDANGIVLSPGDSVVLIKDLNVKGTSFVGKRGTAVRRISLVLDNVAHIEGKINGQTIVILTQYVKKSK